MNKHAQQLYHSLQQDITLYKAKGLSCKQTIEGCFRIAESYTNKIRELLKSSNFKNQVEEIEFFKIIKPQFRALREYYALMYHALLFCEAATEEDQKQFWSRESTRLEKFIQQNSAFYQYYKSGANNQDASWFVKEKVKQAMDIPPDELYSTPYTRLAAQLLALEKYDAYIKKKIDNGLI